MFWVGEVSCCGSSHLCMWCNLSHLSSIDSWVCMRHMCFYWWRNQACTHRIGWYYGIFYNWTRIMCSYGYWGWDNIHSSKSSRYCDQYMNSNVIVPDCMVCRWLVIIWMNWFGRADIRLFHRLFRMLHSLVFFRCMSRICCLWGSNWTSKYSDYRWV